MNYIKHIVKDGERLDSIAYAYWGDTNLTPIIMLDNPHLSPVNDIVAGEVVFVREKVDDQTLVNLQNLPPWRQS
jgi:hypothetical protein